MKLLAIDSCTEFLSLALSIGQEGKQVLTYHEKVGSNASQLILPQIQALLNRANIQCRDLEGVAYGAGPGSFTGIRVAIGVTQGLAFANALPVVGISSLLALAQASGRDKVIACLDARMGEVYHAAYEWQENEWIARLSATVCKPELVPQVQGKDWVGVGSGWATYENILANRYQSQLAEIMPEVAPNASAVLTLATPLFLAGQVKLASEASPMYIRDRVALTSQERAQGETL